MDEHWMRHYSPPQDWGGAGGGVEKNYIMKALDGYNHLTGIGRMSGIIRRN